MEISASASPYRYKDDAPETLPDAEPLHFTWALPAPETVHESVPVSTYAFFDDTVDAPDTKILYESRKKAVNIKVILLSCNPKPRGAFLRRAAFFLTNAPKKRKILHKGNFPH